MARVLLERSSMNEQSWSQSGEAERILEAGARLLDVRAADDFAACHVAGAESCPGAELGDRAAALAGETIVLYGDGPRGDAAATLRAAGATVFDAGACTLCPRCGHGR
jgi:rhodanese-related sulfurtransferase